MLWFLCVVVCEVRVEIQYFCVDVHGSVMLYISSSSCVLYSAGSGVKRVHVIVC